MAPLKHGDGGLTRTGDVLHAAGRGLVGAMAMTGVRAVTGGLGLVGQTPPQAILRQQLPRALGRLRRRRRDAVIEVFHWAYGAAGGAVYGALPRTLHRPPFTGVAYGLGVWLAFEMAIAPLFQLHRSRRRLGTERVAFAIDHVLYGLVLSEIRPAEKARRSEFA